METFKTFYVDVGDGEFEIGATVTFRGDDPLDGLSIEIEEARDWEGNDVALDAIPRRAELEAEIDELAHSDFDELLARARVDGQADYDSWRTDVAIEASCRERRYA